MSVGLIIKLSYPQLSGSYSLLTSHALIDEERGRHHARAKAIDCDKQIRDEFEWLSYVLILI